ncbi:Zinc finger, BED-type [Trema orientale]|uniref:Zinc finger, BED-type n=1 Tax=Trema orientale TaxID=63057 RepID=A0A2P5AT73_TREOI|nr:Zinc finger, BED-type [Trema orientale]
MDDDQIRIAEEVDQVPEMQNNPNASGSCSQFQDSCSPSASTISKRARTTSDVWDYFDPEFKDEADGRKTKMARCKYCKKLLTAKPSSGTAHLKRHSDACVKKHKKDNEPTQSTLQLNKDGLKSATPEATPAAAESMASQLILDKTNLLVRKGNLFLLTQVVIWLKFSSVVFYELAMCELFKLP